MAPLTMGLCACNFDSCPWAVSDLMTGGCRTEGSRHSHTGPVWRGTPSRTPLQVSTSTPTASTPPRSTAPSTLPGPPQASPFLPVGIFYHSGVSGSPYITDRDAFSCCAHLSQIVARTLSMKTMLIAISCGRACSMTCFLPSDTPSVELTNARVSHMHV